MGEALTYNVPLDRVAQYRGCRLAVRGRDPAAIAADVAPRGTPDLVYVQLLDTSADPAPLMPWWKGVPLDLVLKDPVAEHPHLYRWVRLRESHPLRVTVPVVAGFSMAVKVAVALHLEVKLEMVRQPDAERIAELAAVMDLYLHRPTVSEPVEWFNSLLLSRFWADPIDLWSVQEEDPGQVRYVTDDGEETLSPRFASVPLLPDIGAFVREQQHAARAPGSECAACPYWESCRGYFKWPDAAYRCDGVKSLFATLWASSDELRKDVDAALAVPGGKPQ